MLTSLAKKSLLTSLASLLTLSLVAWTARPALGESRVEIREGHFYVDHELFYVRAVGYAPWRPHQKPGVSYVNTNHRWTRMDFERIKAAHFNTIRTWDALAPEELALAREYGLWVLQGIRLDTHQDFSDPHNQESAVAQVQLVAEQSKDYDNVLGYVLLTEPSAAVVLDSGVPETLRFFRQLKRTVQAVDPRPVTIDSWIPLAFMDHNDFDFAMFNAYRFWPKSLTDALGFPGYVRWLSDRFGTDRPLIIGETGGYSVSTTSQTASGGFGGLSEYEQSIRDLQSVRDTVQGHADGSVLVSWIDTWHYPRDPDVHDDEPWEWDGLLAVPTDSAKDMNGIPRRVLGDVTQHNEAILVEPKADHIYPREQDIPILVFTAENVDDVRFNLNGSDWTSMTGSGHGTWRGFFKLPKTARKRQRLAIQSLDRNRSVLNEQSISILTAVTPEHVDIKSSLSSAPHHEMEFSVAVVDDSRHPIAQRKVQYGFFYPVTQREAQGVLTTGIDGKVTLHCPLAPKAEDRYLYVAAGTDSPEHVRTGDLRIFTLGK